MYLTDFNKQKRIGLNNGLRVNTIYVSRVEENVFTFISTDCREVRNSIIHLGVQYAVYCLTLPADTVCALRLRPLYCRHGDQVISWAGSADCSAGPRREAGHFVSKTT
jgi:hypothetical protein